MNKIVSIKATANQSAVEVLEDALEMAKSGHITAVAVSCITKDNSISGEYSNGPNQLMLWASLEHAAKSFYLNHIFNEDI